MYFEELSIFDFLPPKEVQRPAYMDGAKVLSLFDGMACGMLAMLEAGVKVDRYVAYEIDKYAVKTSQHNFPMIEHKMLGNGWTVAVIAHLIKGAV